MWFRSIVLAAALLTPTGLAGRAAAAEPVTAARATVHTFGHTLGHTFGPTGARTTPPPEPVPEVTDNPFIPENANLGDCVSSLPRPECGSTARGGVGQWLVFGALVGGLGFIGWRVSRGIRKGRPTTQG